MKVLLIGAEGQLGRALQVTAPAAIALSTAGRAACDLREGESIRAIVDETAPDLIINTAAYTAVDRAEGETETAFAVNADAVRILAETHAGQLVHISTDYVFDGKAPRANGPHAKRNPLSAYGRSKAAGEDHLRPHDLLIRTSWLYSAGGDNFVRTMLLEMSSRDEIHVVADQIGAPTWAPGLANVIWGLIAADAVGTYHHSDAGVASWYDFAVAIQEEARALGLLDRTVPITPVTSTEYAARAKRPPFSLLDSSATRQLLGDGHTHWRMNLWHMLRAEKYLG